MTTIERMPTTTAGSGPANCGHAERSATAAPQRPGGLPLPALVFCRSRKRVEGVARELAATLGWNRVGAYHAGLTKEERSAIESWFFHADDAVLVATCAYGMGVDKSNIRTTIHYDLPGTVEAYLQESGRAGRDGGPAESVVLLGAEDAAGAQREADPVRRGRYEQLLGYCRTRDCRRTFLMGMLGSESEACFGCDNCRAQAAGDGGRTGGPAGSGRQDPLQRVALELDEARRGALLAVRRNAGLLTEEQLARILSGRSEASDRAAAARTEAPLAHWTEREVRELLANLVASGAIRRDRRGPWKGRLRPARLRQGAAAPGPGWGDSP